MTEPSGASNKARRSFLASALTWLGVSSLLASAASSLYANFRFFFPKVLYQPPFRFKAGFPGDYLPGAVSDRWYKDHRVWIVRDGDKLYAMLAACTHLGCLTGFTRGERLFKCPCHGSNFSLQGDPLVGPAPVPMHRLSISLGEDGQLVIDKAVRENRPGIRDRSPFVYLVEG
ncbi:MAG: Rieske 2Fe-2S domain-containing protein [Planctomycetes bacterium]|nr:Rieske 2Fe-2S domain-containing protein [Planctomycetota bacterium]